MWLQKRVKFEGPFIRIIKNTTLVMYKEVKLKIIDYSRSESKVPTFTVRLLNFSMSSLVPVCNDNNKQLHVTFYDRKNKKNKERKKVRK